MYKMSCLDWKHPIRSIKNCWWRITKGYCPDDVWEWYEFMAQLSHDTLIYLANNHCGTMLEYENKDEEYTEKLRDIANTILRATDYEDTYDNPFRELYYKDLENVEMVDGKLSFEKTDKELFNHYINVEQKNSKRASQDLKEAYGWILDRWWEMWD